MMSKRSKRKQLNIEKSDALDQLRESSKRLGEAGKRLAAKRKEWRKRATNQSDQ